MAFTDTSFVKATASDGLVCARTGSGNRRTAEMPATPPSKSPSKPPLGRIIEMAATGLWVIKREGGLASAGGRMFWADRGSLERAAGQAGIPLSDIVVRTGATGTGSV